MSPLAWVTIGAVLVAAVAALAVRRRRALPARGPTAALDERRVDLGRIRLNYAVGPDNGPALVLVPGQGADWTNYAPVLVSLAAGHRLFVVDVRGHGKSDRTPGNYSFAAIGEDMAVFLDRVVGRPAVVSGHSSGGLVALWLAANRPDLVRGIVLEDAPLFSADWPRIRDDSYVYRVLELTVEMSRILREERSVARLAAAFARIRRPVGAGRVRTVPHAVALLVAALIRMSQWLGGRRLPLPGRLASVIGVLDAFDPDFAQAFLDGRMQAGFDHAAALARVRCPVLLLHANWLRDPEFGLVGAMDDDDAARARRLVPQAEYRRIDSEHGIHWAKPGLFVAKVTRWMAGLPDASR